MTSPYGHMTNSDIDELAAKFNEREPKKFEDVGCCGCSSSNVKLYMGRFVCDDCEAVNGSYIDSLPEWTTPADGKVTLNDAV
jgi:hypothetical protein